MSPDSLLRLFSCLVLGLGLAGYCVGLEGCTVAVLVLRVAALVLVFVT